MCHLTDDTTVACDAVKACETLTSISNLDITDNIFSFTYYDEQGVGNLKSLDLSSLAGVVPPPLIFNNGLTLNTGVVKLGGALLQQTTISVPPSTFFRVTNQNGYFSVDPTQTTLTNQAIQLSYFVNSLDQSGDIPPLNFLYTDSNGYLTSGSIDYLIDALAPTPYTSSQGIFLDGLDFRFGDAAISGTGLSPKPLTSDRDLTGDYRISFKNKNTFFGVNNADVNTWGVSNIGTPYSPTLSKVKIQGNDNGSTFGFVATNLRGDTLIAAANNRDVYLAGLNSSSPYHQMVLSPSVNKIYLKADNTPTVLTFESTGTTLLWTEPNTCNKDKFVIQNSVSAANNTRISSFKVDANLGYFLYNVQNGKYSDIWITGIAPEINTLPGTPEFSSLRIDREVVPPFSYNGGVVTFVDITPTYYRSTVGGTPTGVATVRGMYYHPNFVTPNNALQIEYAFESTRGSVVFGAGRGDEVVKFPSLSTTQRNALTTTSAELLYNNTEKLFEYSNGYGVVSAAPAALTTGTVTWDTCKLNKTITLNANTTITLSNLVAGSTLVLVVIQDGVGGRTLTINAPGTTIKSLGSISAAAGETSLITFYVASTSLILKSVSQPYV